MTHFFMVYDGGNTGWVEIAHLPYFLHNSIAWGCKTLEVWKAKHK